MIRRPKIRSADIILMALVLTIFPMLWALSILKTAPTRAGTPLLEANKILTHYAIEEVFNNGRLAAADEIFAPDYHQHEPNLPMVILGPAGIKQLTTLYRSTFFNLHYTVEDVVAEGDKVVIRWTASGLYIRAFGLYPPAGQQVRWTGMTIYRIANGQIVESWTNQDDMNFLKQLGVTTLTGVTWGPSYSADGTMNEMITNRDITTLQLPPPR